MPVARLCLYMYGCNTSLYVSSEIQFIGLLVWVLNCIFTLSAAPVDGYLWRRVNFYVDIYKHLFVDELYACIISVWVCV